MLISRKNKSMKKTAKTLKRKNMILILQKLNIKNF